MRRTFTEELCVSVLFAGCVAAAAGNSGRGDFLVRREHHNRKFNEVDLRSRQNMLAGCFVEKKP